MARRLALLALPALARAGIGQVDVSMLGGPLDVVVMLTAAGCEPCSVLVPHLEGLHVRLNAEGMAVHFALLDTARDSRFASVHGVMTTRRIVRRCCSSAATRTHVAQRTPILSNLPKRRACRSRHIRLAHRSIFPGTNLASLVKWLRKVLTPVRPGPKTVRPTSDGSKPARPVRAPPQPLGESECDGPAAGLLLGGQLQLREHEPEASVVAWDGAGWAELGIGLAGPVT